MPWNWELNHWPQFSYNREGLASLERKFLLGTGGLFASLKNVTVKEFKQFVVEILTLEGLQSSKIEGEILDRASLQSSIKEHFDLKNHRQEVGNKESSMAALLCNVYTSYDLPLSHHMLWQWHKELFKTQSHVASCGQYRTHVEAMQIVSNRLGSHKVYFEAPPSNRVPEEMETFIQWFNSTRSSEPILGRAALAHVYFESIHPFEDGNGRIGRVLVEKILSQGIERPILVAVSKVLEKRKKEYYAALERCNKTLEITPWVDFFANAILQAQEESLKLLHFLIAKARMMTSLAGKINSRQEKVLLRIFAEGPNGFKGGLSAEKYIAITKTSRATATRDLNDLLQKEILIKTGELRHTRYWLNL